MEKDSKLTTKASDVRGSINPQLDMNFTTMKVQKAILLKVLNNQPITNEERDELNGILHLIDNIQDQAVNVFGFDENDVFDLSPEDKS